MNGPTAKLFPGQGAYLPGALAGVSHDGRVGSVLDAVDTVAAEFGGQPPSSLLTRSDAPSVAILLRDDVLALQLAIFAVGLAAYHAEQSATPADLLMGHSLGEVTAVTAAGAFDIADGARIICHRTLALLWNSIEKGGMTALQCAGDRAEHIIGAVDDPRLSVAIRNAPMQTVIAGPESALGQIEQVAAALNVSVKRLPVPFAFHSTTMRSAARQCAQLTSTIAQRPLRARVFSPGLGGWFSDSHNLTEHLSRDFAEPLDFLAAVRTLHSRGVRRYLEMGPTGHVIRLVQASVPDVVPVPALAFGREGRPSTSVDNGAPAPAIVSPELVPVQAGKPHDAILVANGTASFSSGELLDELTTVYATALDYPVESFSPDVQLEADLGIDSIKQTEMMVRVCERYGLSPLAEDFRVSEYPTLRSVARFIDAGRPSSVSSR